jgi:hypothetical protein
VARESPCQSEEFALLAAATVRPLRPERLDTVAWSSLDWRRFLALVERHRIAPLAFAGVTGMRDRVPEHAYQQLRAAALRDRTATLQLVALLASVTARLAEAGVEAISIKGPTLGMLAFGDASLRQSRDLDVLIAPEQLPAALDALSAADFRVVQLAGGTDADRVARWMGMMKDLSLVHLPTGALVELHWRLANNPHLLPLSVAQSRQAVDIGAARLGTLGADDLLLYLCVHGARHGWFRLKWLADVHALLAAAGPGGAERFHARAASAGLAAPAGQMLELLREVYGLPVPPALEPALKRWRTRALVVAARRSLFEPRAPDQVRFGTTAIGVCQLIMRRELRYTAREVAELLIDWPVAIRRGGTRSGYALAVLGRPLLWVARLLRPRAVRLG